ncbi:D123-domain-containing protein [Trametes versicolor FP-101664 SS1]|uniref:D123-domain-containing protein n=1 Tax=Trametes versicolor (strain FP-101664) TaxID=717944 RepID=UPI0004624269|nr:D123-domain-containing protein [Trametes versicolor FP-101664 SS1]EIW59585.1 D123-domain-containing protein [Trametes versicolor FP-101664 SS1]
MPAPVSTPALFPPHSPDALLAFQFSSWYPRFADHSIKSTIVRPLSAAFCEYLNSDGVFVPEGAEDLPAESTLSDDEDASDAEDEDDEFVKFAFPELDAKIRAAVAEYGAVFPKLNFSSPRDAAWILPASSPLKCTTPADVYLLLKSSDFVQLDLTPELVFADCEPARAAADDASSPYELELVLRKWYPVDRARELRCFVRQETLIGISQRDPNYYDFWNEHETQEKVAAAVADFWETHIKGKWEQTQGDYTFDFLLTRDLSRGHIVDFNPYLPRTDPLLFTYEELHAILLAREGLELRVVDSPAHPAAARNAPAHQPNMVPIEALTMSSGRDVGEFADALQEEIRKSMAGEEVGEDARAPSPT